MCSSSRSAAVRTRSSAAVRVTEARGGGAASPKRTASTASAAPSSRHLCAHSQVIVLNVDSRSSRAEARHFEPLPVRAATMPNPSARHDSQQVPQKCRLQRTRRHPQHTYHCVALGPPVRRASISTIIIRSVDAELVAVSTPHCGPRLDDCSPAAHVLGMPGVAAMRLQL